MRGTDHQIGYRILGPIEVVVGGQLVPTGSPQQRGLLALLLLNANKIVRAESIISALWDDPPATALGQIQTRVWRLRQLLRAPEGPADGAPCLATMSGGYRLVVAPGALDLEQFKRAVERARRLAASRRLEQSANAMHEALAIWRGPALADVETSRLRADAANLEELRLAAMEERIETELALGRHRELIPELRTMVATHPLRERPRAHLMLALYRAGRQAEALEAFASGYRLLVDNLGLEPTADLRLLHNAILTGDRSLDLKEEVQISTQPRVPRELPPGVTAFSGRERLRAELRALLTNGNQPRSVITTISGSPGIGKTALAVELGHAVAEHFPDGQIFLDLRGQDTRPATPCEVLASLLTRFGLAGDDLPETTWERGCAYRTIMADQRALLVLDDAASPAQVRPLLPGGSRCAVLVTSRRRFATLECANHIELDAMTQPEALRLLGRIVGEGRLDAESAQARRIVQLCGRLPLAVWAAGARICARPHWTLARFADQLDRPEHRLDMLSMGDLDVRAALATSYRQLETRQRLLFRGLGSLPSGQTSSWLCGELVGASAEEGEQLLDDLVEAHLVDVVELAGGFSYQMSELVRLFARERCADDDVDHNGTAILSALGRRAEERGESGWR